MTDVINFETSFLIYSNKLTRVHILHGRVIFRNICIIFCLPQQNGLRFITQSDLYLTNATIRKAFSVNGGLVFMKQKGSTCMTKWFEKETVQVN